MSLKTIMRNRGLKQVHIAEALRVSPPVVSRWFNRTADVPSRQVRPLADLLGVSAEVVLANGLADKPTAPSP